MYSEGTAGCIREEGDRTYAISREDIFVINSFQMHSVVLEENGLAISLSLSPSFLAAGQSGNRRPECELQIISA